MGTEILQTKGILSYITSNKWMRAKYGKSLRKYFTNKKPVQLIDLGPGIFEAATVDTNILFVQNTKIKKHLLNALTLKNKEQIFKLQESDFTVMNDLSENSWVVLSPIEQSIKQKIEKVGIPLKDWDITINYGIKTGYNEAFIIDKTTKERIIKEDPKSAEIIRPILRGRDIKKYSSHFAELYLIATFPSKNYNIEDFPGVKCHLLSFGKKRLSQIGGKESRKRTNNQWFETQDSIGYWEDFSKQKIIYPNMTKFLPFHLDNEHFVTNQKCFIITGKHLAYLTAFLNSSIFKYCFLNSFPELQGGTRELSKVFFENIPVKCIDDDLNNKFKALVQAIRIELENGNEIKTHLKSIDEIILDLYNISKRDRLEIGFIEII